jgi:hypothetical protein
MPSERFDAVVLRGVRARVTARRGTARSASRPCPRERDRCVRVPSQALRAGPRWQSGLGVIGPAHRIGPANVTSRPAFTHISGVAQLAASDNRVIQDADHCRAERSLRRSQRRSAGRWLGPAHAARQRSATVWVFSVLPAVKASRFFGVIDTDAQRHRAQVVAEMDAVDHPRDQGRLVQRLGNQLDQPVSARCVWRAARAVQRIAVAAR